MHLHIFISLFNINVKYTSTSQHAFVHVVYIFCISNAAPNWVLSQPIYLSFFINSKNMQFLRGFSHKGEYFLPLPWCSCRFFSILSPSRSSAPVYPSVGPPCLCVCLITTTTPVITLICGQTLTLTSLKKHRGRCGASQEGQMMIVRLYRLTLPPFDWAAHKQGYFCLRV